MTQLTRRQLMWTGAATAVAAALPHRRAARAAATGPRKNLIIVLAGGGWDTSYSIDPKPVGGFVDAPDGTITTHGTLDILHHANREAIGDYFTAYAPITAVVRGICMPSVAHQACMQSILTGARNETSPDMAAIVAQTHGPELPIPYLVLGNQAFAGPYASSMGRVGQTNQLVSLLDPSQAYLVDGRSTRAFVPSASDESYIRAYTRARTDRERAVRGATGYNKRRIDDFVGSLGRGDTLRTLSSGLGSPGTALSFVEQRQLALDALETGVSRTVMLSAGTYFDTHENNAAQGANQQFVFLNLLALVSELEARQGSTVGSRMIDETIVMVVSEMGRTPKLNDAGAPGKDHWPVTSAMVIGANIRGNRAFGATADDGEAMKVDFTTGEVSAATTARSIEPRHLAAGVLSACGVDPENHLPEAEVYDAFVA